MTFLSIIGAAVLIIPLVILFLIGSVLWKSWWLYPAWGWFFVPLGIRPISFWHFTGLMCIVSLFTQQTDTHKDERKTDWSIMALIFLWPIAAWAILRWLHLKG